MASLITFLLILLMTFSYGHSAAQGTALNKTKVLAVVPVLEGNLNQNVYRQFDRIVPQLKQLYKDNIIKLECRYSGQAEREQDVLKAYQLAGNIEKYFRERHNLNLDLWITISLDHKKSKDLPFLTVALFADDIKRLDSMPIYSKLNK